MPWIISVGLKILAALVLALLVYLWIPEKSPRKRKGAITRLNQTLEGGRGTAQNERGKDLPSRKKQRPLPVSIPHWHHQK
ncbi:hypothetical protein DRN98_09375, partial [Methanosarcinales archaeon]